MDVSTLRSDAGSSCIVDRPDDWLKYEYDLDVIVPVYNTGILLKKCLDSILEQSTSYQYRILVVDDGSTDPDTIRFLDEYEKYDKIEIFHTKNGGLPAARDYAIARSKGKYFTFVDSDDYLYENSIERMMSVAVSENADIVEGGYNNISWDDKIIHTYNHKNGILEELYGYAWGKVYSRELFHRIEYPLYGFEDSITETILKPIANKIVGISDIVYAYRRNRKSLSYVMQGNDKSIDSFWITHQINKDRKQLGLVNDQQYYEYMLRVIQLTFRRNIHLKDEYQMDLFDRFCAEMNDFKDYKTNNSLYSDLELAIKQHNFSLYKLWNKMHMFE